MNLEALQEMYFTKDVIFSNNYNIIEKGFKGRITALVEVADEYIFAIMGENYSPF